MAEIMIYLFLDIFRYHSAQKGNGSVGWGRGAIAIPDFAGKEKRLIRTDIKRF